MIFSMHTEVKVCGYTLVCTDTIRESALKVDWEKNPLLHRRIRPASAACRSDAHITKALPMG